MLVKLIALLRVLMLIYCLVRVGFIVGKLLVGLLGPSFSRLGVSRASRLTSF